MPSDAIHPIHDPSHHQRKKLHCGIFPGGKWRVEDCLTIFQQSGTMILRPKELLSRVFLYILSNNSQFQSYTSKFDASNWNWTILLFLKLKAYHPKYYALAKCRSGKKTILRFNVYGNSYRRYPSKKKIRFCIDWWRCWFLAIFSAWTAFFVKL